MRILSRVGLSGIMVSVIVALALVIVIRERRIDELKEARARHIEHWPRLSRILADDPHATQVDLLDLQGEDRDYLEHVLDQIFPEGTDQLDDQAQCLEILRYVASRLKFEDTVGTATECLQQGRAICGGMAVVYVALCRAADIPARKIGMYNLPGMGCHAVAEAYYDDGWHLFDPTFGVFFGSQPQYGSDTTVAGLTELFDLPEQWHLFKVVDKPWTGKYDQAVRSRGVTPVEDSYLSDRYHFVLRSEYAEYLRVAFPVEVGWPLMSFPLTADLRERPIATIGTSDESELDLWSHGHYQLGPGGFHTWSIKGAKGQRVTIDYTMLGANPASLAILPLKGVRSARWQVEGHHLTVSFQSSDDDAIVAILARENVPLEAIRVVKQSPHDGSSSESAKKLAGDSQIQR